MATTAPRPAGCAIAAIHGAKVAAATPAATGGQW
jgi:hypothetical protein